MTWKCTNTPKGENKLYSDAKGVVPSLDLRFAEGKNLNDYMTGQNLITFSRSSIGTYVDENGIIQTATADTPRFDHDPTTGESLGLLIEESRTNLVTYSEQFDNAAWFPTSSGTFVVTPNASLAPDGTTTADLVVGNNASTWITSNGGAVSAGDYTFSVWLKSDTPQTAEILMSYGVTDILSCSVTTDWQRFTLTATRAATVALFVGVNVGNAKNIYIWGAQLEAGSFPTSYIPTTGTALTRSADVASITGSNFSSWYNPNKTTLYIESPEFPNYSRLANGAFVYISDTSVSPISLNDGIKFGTGSPSTYNRVFVTEAGVNYATTAGTQASKFAIAVATNDFNYVSDGISIGTATSVVMPTGMDRLAISSYGPGYAHLSRLTYFPERLPDSSLQTMTAP